MVRATAANAQIRAFACTTKETVETARAAHNTSPVVTAALGRLLSAGAMMGSMLKGEDELITLQIKGDGPVGGLTVTADGNGHVKGYANVPDVILPANAQGKLDVGSRSVKLCSMEKSISEDPDQKWNAISPLWASAAFT